VTGTLRMILEPMWKPKQMFNPQAFFPHVYSGSIPRKEALKITHLFAESDARGAKLAGRVEHGRPFPRCGGIAIAA